MDLQSELPHRHCHQCLAWSVPTQPVPKVPDPKIVHVQVVISWGFAASLRRPSPRLLPSDRDARVCYLMLQTAPLLLSYTLSNYLYFVDQNLVIFVVGFATFVPLSHPLLLYPVTAHPRSFSHLSFVSRFTKHLLPERETTRPKSGGPIVWAGAAPSMEISHM